MKGPSIVSLCALLLCSGGSFASASPVVRDETAPPPADASKILATTGVLLGYRLLVRNGLISQRLTIWDDVANTKRTFVLTFGAKINGRPLTCDGSCSALPAGVVAGHTRIVLTYWERPDDGPIINAFDRLPFADAIWTIPAVRH